MPRLTFHLSTCLLRNLGKIFLPLCIRIFLSALQIISVPAHTVVGSIQYVISVKDLHGTYHKVNDQGHLSQNNSCEQSICLPPIHVLQWMLEATSNTKASSLQCILFFFSIHAIRVRG